MVSSLFLIISNNILYPILRETSKYINDVSTTKPTSLQAKLVLQLFPSVLVTALLIALIGYSRLTVEKGNLLNEYYKNVLSTTLDRNINSDNFSEIASQELSDSLMNSNDFIFLEYFYWMIVPRKRSTLSHFFVKYMHELSPTNDNRVYEAYTIDAQGVVKQIEYNGQTYTVGIYYEIVSSSLLYYFLFSSVILFLFDLMILIYITRSINANIKNVNDGLKEIILHSEDIKNSKLPVTSDDVLGELAISFNKIQDLTKNNIEQIHNSQERLMERERLASLGQLIGGIAHNLKTPIMSISGAAEGLSDLIKEYDSSIDDPQVTSQDHHDIAKDMSEWVSKIKTHTEYMSDIITAVKGQAVTLSGDENYSFTIEELVKRVNILMKHELKNALIYLNVSMNVDSNLSLNGDINSLVQVINNMISNAIQAYNGETNKNIDLIISRNSNNLIICIKDYACGLSESVKDKLFKEMVTTKGKNGTGLGLYMSYSNIRAHFNGNITFESEPGRGTSFYIILPI